MNTLFDRLYFLTGLNFKDLSTFNLDFILFFSQKLIIKNYFDGFFINTLLNSTISNYYASDIFTKNSKIMSLCAIKVPYNNFSLN